MTTKCSHKFVHLRTESWYNKNRYTNSFFMTDYFFCEKCLQERKVEKVELDVSIYKDAPEWTIGITRNLKSE